MAHVVGGLCAVLVLGGAGQTPGQECRDVRIAFQPDCFRSSLQAPCAPRKNGDQLDLGPQIAIWVEQGGRYVTEIMVTNLTAVRGLGNRPGRWDHASAPRFPYGRRTNVLPVWAHARGRLFPRVVMQDGNENDLGFHEIVSSPDPYYCRPMALNEIDVDAVTCPTAVFNSAKGRFDPSVMEVYPPRRDLVTFTGNDCDVPRAPLPCARSAERFASMNDLDGVAAATPPYGRVHTVVWRAPRTLAAGDYLLRLEINKEFDQNASHRYPAFTDPRLADSGVKTNIGQPSVVFAVPFTLGAEASYGAATTMQGYGAWDGASGVLNPPDSTISNSPGSGVGRLLEIPSPWHPASEQRIARVHVSTAGCDSCVPLPPAPPAPGALTVESVSHDAVVLGFLHPDANGTPVEGYEVRYLQARSMSEADFNSGLPVNPPSPGVAGTRGTIGIGQLKGQSDYVVGIRARGRCGTLSPIATVAFQTPEQKFTQLSGCFVATAAHGTSFAPQVESLRRLRDRALVGTELGSRAIDLYYRSSPPLADLIARDDALRAVSRQVLAPLIKLSELLDWPSGRASVLTTTSSRAPTPVPAARARRGIR